MPKLGIDAVNLTDGGGLTHIIELLRHADPSQFGFKEVVIWGGEKLSSIDDQPWLEKRIVLDASDSYFKRLTWASRHLPSEFHQQNCDLLFCPAGTFSNRHVRYVSMVQNMLPYDDAQRRLYPWGWNRIRYSLLRAAQKRSLKHSVGNIFVSNYARQEVANRFPFVDRRPSQVIYHGVSDRFTTPANHKPGKPFRLLYVSRVNYYKHQWNVIQAVKDLNNQGHAIQLRLVGEVLPALRPKIDTALRGCQPDWVVLTGDLPTTGSNKSIRRRTGLYLPALVRAFQLS